MDLDSNPYASPHAATRPIKWRQSAGNASLAVVVASLAQVLGLIAGTAAAFGEIESILVSGPLVSILGLVITFVSARSRNLLGVIFGISAPLFAGLVFALINIREWGPGDAQKPVSRLILVYVLAAAPFGSLAILAALHGRQTDDESPFADEIK